MNVALSSFIDFTKENLILVILIGVCLVLLAVTAVMMSLRYLDKKKRVAESEKAADAARETAEEAVTASRNGEEGRESGLDAVPSAAEENSADAVGEGERSDGKHGRKKRTTRTAVIRRRRRRNR